MLVVDLDDLAGHAQRLRLALRFGEIPCGCRLGVPLVFLLRLCDLFGVGSQDMKRFDDGDDSDLRAG